MKPPNVFLTDEKKAGDPGTIKLGDMNISKVLKAGFLATKIGTPYYISPEILGRSSL